MTDDAMDDVAKAFRAHLLADGFTVKEADMIVERLGRASSLDKRAVPEARERARRIVSLCKVIGRPQAAARLIASGKPYAEIQTALRANPWDAMALTVYAWRGTQSGGQA